MVNKKSVKRIWFYIAAILICLVMIAPVYILVKISFSVPDEVLTQHPTFG